ncbi:MAG: hypothetical protein GY814_02210 [Gammaproteobacteria bacterium]|nr:hypothetical protein [Gammaproteobacteria bacterium]
MADILPKKVLFNNTEAISHVDFNEMQNRMLIHQIEGIALRQRWESLDVLPYVQGNDCAQYHDTGKTTSNLEGMLYQIVDTDSPDGTTQKILNYYMDAGELETVHTAPTDGSKRYDIIAVRIDDDSDSDSTSRDFKDATTGALSTQLFDKTRGTSLTIQVVEGTEVLLVNSASKPDTPEGFIRMCAVLVSDSADINPLEDDIEDYRLPIGKIMTYHMRGNDFSSVLGSEHSAYGVLVTGNSGGEVVYAHCPVASGLHRIMRIDTTLRNYGTTEDLAIDLIRMDEGASFFGTVETVLGQNSISPMDAAFQATVGPGDPSSKQLSPLWSNGYKSGYAADHALSGWGAMNEGVSLKFTTGAGSSTFLMNARWTTIG